MTTKVTSQKAGSRSAKVQRVQCLAQRVKTAHRAPDQLRIARELSTAVREMGKAEQ